MIRPLYARERRLLAQTSAALCGGSLLLVPLLAPHGSQAEAGGLVAPARIAVPQVPDRLAYPSVDVRRDPFLSGVTAVPPAGGSAPVVRAVVLGASPQALVEEGGAARVIHIGSALAGSTVAGIAPDGLVLDDGRRLPLAVERP